MLKPIFPRIKFIATAIVIVMAIIGTACFLHNRFNGTKHENYDSFSYIPNSESPESESIDDQLLISSIINLSSMSLMPDEVSIMFPTKPARDIVIFEGLTPPFVENFNSSNSDKFMLDIVAHSRYIKYWYRPTKENNEIIGLAWDKYGFSRAFWGRIQHHIINLK